MESALYTDFETNNERTAFGVLEYLRNKSLKKVKYCSQLINIFGENLFGDAFF